MKKYTEEELTAAICDARSAAYKKGFANGMVVATQRTLEDGRSAVDRLQRMTAQEIHDLYHTEK